MYGSEGVNGLCVSIGQKIAKYLKNIQIITSSIETNLIHLRPHHLSDPPFD